MPGCYDFVDGGDVMMLTHRVSPEWEGGAECFNFTFSVVQILKENVTNSWHLTTLTVVTQ